MPIQKPEKAADGERPMPEIWETQKAPEEERWKAKEDFILRAAGYEPLRGGIWRKGGTEPKEKITMDWPYFEALLSEEQGVPVLRTSGDVILATIPLFRAALEEALEAVERTEGSEPVLVVDLRETEFMDSVGLATLLGSTEGLRKRGGEARLVSPSEPVRRMLEVTGLSNTFGLYPDVLSAAEGLRELRIPKTRE